MCGKSTFLPLWLCSRLESVDLSSILTVHFQRGFRLSDHSQVPRSWFSVAPHCSLPMYESAETHKARKKKTSEIESLDTGFLWEQRKTRCRTPDHLNSEQNPSVSTPRFSKPDIFSSVSLTHQTHFALQRRRSFRQPRQNRKFSHTAPTSLPI